MESIHATEDRTRATGFQMIPSCALNAMANGEISPAAYATLAAITSFARDTREQREATGGDRQTVRLFRRDLAAMTGATVRTVSFHTAQLKEAGLVTISQDPWGGPSMYTCQDPCGECFSEQPAAAPLATDRNTPSNELQGIPGLRSVDHQSEDDLGKSEAERFEAAAEQRHREHADAAVAEKKKRGDSFNTDPAAYHRAILNNQEQREQFREQVRKEREAKRKAKLIADCGACDGNGNRWHDADGNTVAYDALEAVGANTCAHGAEVPA